MVVMVDKKSAAYSSRPAALPKVLSIGAAYLVSKLLLTSIDILNGLSPDEIWALRLARRYEMYEA
jgi:hypothetical protein